MAEENQNPSCVDTFEDDPYAIGVTTKTGDDGTSSLYNGKRVPKNDIHFEALGALDECNSFIGLAREYITDACKEVDEYLEAVQCLIFDVSSAVATPLHNSSARAIKKTTFEERHIKDMEKWAFLLNKEIPPQTAFVIPSGGKAASHIHVARAVCRRAERLLTPLLQQGDIEKPVFIFVNRLSDFLFVVSRYISMKENNPPKEWRKY